MRFSGALPPGNGSVASADIPESSDVPSRTSVSNDALSRIDALISLRDQSLSLCVGPCIDAIPWHEAYSLSQKAPFLDGKVPPNPRALVTRAITERIILFQ